MKKTTIFFFLLLSIDCLFAQNDWERATRTADSLDLEQQFEASLPYRVKAIEAAKNAPDSIHAMLLGFKQFTQAEHDFSTSRGENPDAYSLMRGAVGTFVSEKARPERIYKAYWTLSQRAFDYMYNQSDAETYLDSAFAYHAKAQQRDTLFLIEAMEFSGFMSAISRKYEKAIEVSENAIGLFDQYGKINNKAYELKAKLYYNLALVHNNEFLDIPQKEYLYTVESEKVLAKMDNPDIEHLVLVYRRLALFERDYSNYKNAKGYINKAMRLYEQHKEAIRAKVGVGFKLELALYRALIVIHMESGNEEEMLETLGKVEEMARKNTLDETEKGAYKGALRQVSNYYLYQKTDPDEALKYIDKARHIHLDVKKSTHDIASFGRGIELQLASAYFLKKSHQKAFDILEEIEPLSALSANQQILLYELKAKLLLDLGRSDEATNEINRLMATIAEGNSTFRFGESEIENFIPGNGINDAEVLVRLAEAWRDYRGHYSMEEEKLYWTALTQFENNIDNHPLTKDLKGSFDRISAGLLEAALSREFSIAESNHLLTFMETVESRSLIDRFLMNRELAGNTALYKLVEKEQYIRAHITLLKKKQQESKEESLKQELFEKELELKKLREQITSEYLEYASLAIPDIKIESVTDKSIIKFKAIGDNLFKIHLYNGTVTYEKIADYTALTKEIKTYLAGISNIQAEMSMLKTQGEAIYRKLFPQRLDSSELTVIIPDDVLYYLPFGLLVENNQYLLENHTISYASNFSFINTEMIKNKRAKATGVAFFAPAYSGSIGESQLAVRGASYALSGAQEEVNEIAKLVPGEKYTGDAASKTAFKSLAGNTSILHLAMHSNLNDEDPELSSLVFSDVEKDYELYISELYGLNFDADLAVLSACNTAIGGFKDGGSLVSMHHAFTTAGIPATLASLWSAPDQSTKEIMVSFYKNLKQGKNKAQALQLAKLKYLENAQNENLKHPFYWAGFVLSGNNSPVHFSEPFWKQPVFGIVLLSILTVLLVVGYLRKRKSKSTSLGNSVPV